MTDKETFDKFDLIKEIERLRSENDALKEDLTIVRQFRDNIAKDLEEARLKIKELQDWHDSHV